MRKVPRIVHCSHTKTTARNLDLLLCVPITLSCVHCLPNKWDSPAGSASPKERSKKKYNRQRGNQTPAASWKCIHLILRQRNDNMCFQIHTGVFFLSSILQWALSAKCHEINWRTLQEPRNRFPACRVGTTILFVVPTTRLHRLAESIPRNRFLGSINSYKNGLTVQVQKQYSTLKFSKEQYREVQ